MDEFYVYEHTRNDTGAVFYVGKGMSSRAHRTSQRNDHWNRITAKHGRSVRIVASGLDEELALLCEIELIDKYRRIGVALVNLTAGGDGVRLTAEANARRAESVRLAYQAPELRAVAQARSRAFAADPEALARRNASIKAAYLRPDVRAKIKKNARTPLALANHKAAMERPEVREKLRQANAVRVQCIETGQIFPMVLSAVQWLKENGRPKAQGVHICQASAGKVKTAYGYTWRYISRED